MSLSYFDSVVAIYDKLNSRKLCDCLELRYSEIYGLCRFSFDCTDFPTIVHDRRVR